VSAFRREDFTVTTRDGVRLRARLVERSGVDRDAPLVVLVHGIAAPLEPTYDLPVPGYSFLEELAKRGLRAVALDHRNFGKSDRDPRLSRPPIADPDGRGLHSLDDSVEDIRAVVEDCRTRFGVDRLTLFGSSRGAIQVLAAALDLAQALELAILNNPSSLCYLSGATGGPALAAMKEERDGARRENDYMPYTAEYQRKRWKKLFGDGSASAVDDDLQEKYIASCLASDEDGSKQVPPVFRVPSEGFPDRVPLLSLPKLAVPTVVVEAEEVPEDHVAAFFAAVPKDRARLLHITGSNHFTLRNARRFELANIIEAAVFGVRAGSEPSRGSRQ
jgi:pimeloyl-ACP methyl ester carboxylesterase